MKKAVLVIVLSLIINTDLQSQGNSKLYISPGIGIGAYSYGYSWGFTLPLLLNVDVKVSDKFSVGAYASYWQSTWDYSLYDSYKFTSSHFGVRGSFHFWQWLDSELKEIDLKSNKFDMYLTAWGGYNIRKFKWTNSNSIYTDPFEINNFNNRAQLGLQLGARYQVNKNISLFTEWGGTPTSWSNFGLSFKF